MNRRDYILVTALLFSLFVYVFYRTENTVINEIIIHLTSLDFYLTTKNQIAAILPLGDVIIYSLPEALWILCITVTSKSFHIQLHNARIPCLIIPLIYCIGLEICQLIGLTKGTFDTMDIALSTLSWFVGKTSFGESHESQNLFGDFSTKTVACFASYGIVYLSHVT